MEYGIVQYHTTADRRSDGLSQCSLNYYLGSRAVLYHRYGIVPLRKQEGGCGGEPGTTKEVMTSVSNKQTNSWLFDHHAATALSGGRH